MNFRNILYIALVVYGIKTWIFTPFIIPSSSMDSTLIQGDYVIVNQWQSSILGNSFEPKKGEITAFHYPLDTSTINKKKVYIKRCIGSPGDSVSVQNGLIHPDEEQVQFDYLINDPNSVINWNILNNLEVHLGGKTTNNNWFLNLSQKQIDALKSKYPNLRFTKQILSSTKIDLSVFPSDTALKWNQDFYGPIYIPRKGDCVQLNLHNIKLYAKIIEIYESHKLQITENKILIDGKQKDSYCFESDYYFMMGDNRHHSKDSRHWGFVPHDHLIGTCATILFNIEDFSFNRLLKPIK